MSSGAASSWSAANRQLRRNLTSTLDDGGHVVEQGLRTGRAGVVEPPTCPDRRAGNPRAPSPTLRRQHPEGHDRTGTALLGASDDHPGAVAVDLDVRTGRTGEARPPRDRDADGLVVRQVVAVGRGPTAASRRRSRSAVHLTGSASTPSSTMLARRNSTGSMPTTAASSSVCDSSARLSAVGARTDPTADGWCRRAMPRPSRPPLHGAGDVHRGQLRKKAASAVYAPLSMAIHPVRATSVPSAFTPEVMSTIIPSSRRSGATISS